MRKLGNEWAAKTPQERESYPRAGVSGSASTLGDIISDTSGTEAWERVRRRLWYNMKKQVMSLLENTDIQCDILDNTYDVSTMLLYVDKHNIATEPQVY